MVNTAIRTLLQSRTHSPRLEGNLVRQNRTAILLHVEGKLTLPCVLDRISAEE